MGSIFRKATPKSYVAHTRRSERTSFFSFLYRTSRLIETIYKRLGGDRYEDAFDTLQALKDQENVKITVFSNGQSSCLKKAWVMDRG